MEVSGFILQQIFFFMLVCVFKLTSTDWGLVISGVMGEFTGAGIWTEKTFYKSYVLFSLYQLYLLVLCIIAKTETHEVVERWN